jgi:ferredoxin
MPTVKIVLPSERVFVVDTVGEDRLMDLCDAAQAPIVFSCRATTCGTCGVWVERGEHLLDPPGLEEAKLRAKLGGDGRRFACAIRVRSGRGVIRLRVCGHVAS